MAWLNEGPGAPQSYAIRTLPVFLSRLLLKNCITTCTEQKAPEKVRFTGHSRIVGPHYETCHMPPIWRLEFGGGS